MTETMKAYIAGIIDADGTIGIKKSTYAMRKIGDSKQPVYSERVCLRQVVPVVVDLLHMEFGGHRYRMRGYTPRARPTNGWSVTDKKAVEFLRIILPYLIIKREQAENCLALRDLKEQSKRQRLAVGRGHVGSAPRSAALSVAMEALLARAHDMNRVGVQP